MTTDTTSQTQIDRRARVIFLLYADVFLLYGAAACLFPEALSRLVELQPSTPSALADLRAMYGGLSLGIGALFLQCARKPGWAAPGLYLAMGCSLLPALGRVYSALVSGVPNALVLSFIAIELASFAWVFAVYRGFEGGSRAAQRPDRQAVQVPG